MAIGTTAAIIGSAAIGAGSSLISGSQQSKAAKSAAQAQASAADRSAEVQREMFNTVWNSGALQRDVAEKALRDLSVTYGVHGSTNNTNVDLSKFTQSPDYRFRYDESMKEGRNALARSGMLQSGAAAKALGDRSANMALGEMDKYRSGLSALAGQGSQAYQTGASAAQNTGNNLANIYQTQGNNQASSYQNQANAWTNALGGVAGAGLWSLNQFAGGRR